MLPWSAHSAVLVGFGASAPSGDGCGTDGLISSWHCENTDLTNSAEVALGSCVDTGEDSTATLNSGATLDTDGTPTPVDGSGTLQLDTSPDVNYEAAVFTTATTTLLKEAKVSGYIYVDTFSSGKKIFYITIDSSNYCYITTQGTSSDISLEFYGKWAGTAKTSTLTTTNYNRTTGEWLYFEVAWKYATSGNDTFLKLCDSTRTNCDSQYFTKSYSTVSASSTGFMWGDNSASNIQAHFDKLKVYKNAGF